MKLTIIAPEMVYEHEVDPSMQVQDIVALVEAEVRALRADKCRECMVADGQTGMPSGDFTLSNDSGVQLNQGDKSLESYGLKSGEATIFITSK